MTCSFLIRNNIIRYQFRRTYQKAIPYKLRSWSDVINSETPRQEKIKYFKQYLQSSLNNKVPIPQEFKAIILRLSNRRIKEGQSSISIRKELQKLILQRRISDDQIYNCIMELSNKKIVNVTVPHHIEKQEGDVKKLNIDLKPTSNDDFKDLFQKLEEHLTGKSRNTNDLYQIISNLLEESKEREDLSFSSEHHTNNVNLHSLHDYLNKIDTQEKQKQAVINAEKRLYDWKNTIEPLNMTTSQLFFNSIKLSKIGKIISNKAYEEGNKKSIRCDYLILDLKDNSKIIKDFQNLRASLNIQDRDVIGILNNSKQAPDIVLNKIKKLEKSQWKPVGNVYGNNEQIVFKRISKSSLDGEQKNRKTYSIIISCLLAMSVYIWYQRVYKMEDVRKTSK